MKIKGEFIKWCEKLDADKEYVSYGLMELSVQSLASQMSQNDFAELMRAVENKPQEYCTCKRNPGDIIYCPSQKEMLEGKCPNCHKPIKPEKPIEELDLSEISYDYTITLAEKINEIIRHLTILERRLNNA